ncbi:alpha N-terminal protein methyltransferase 1-like [Macrosteles quadrilineatus]|uniref:alpha N-terminal protein methyltransferase 1-like n=1 Tax=Macrosteles quadrilineatus TaxID=74068 RepID=UPI0023E1D06B|nr:alpha N-terminal protein methyltransferase 1-like [Macrosteles quadrilineatus]
MNRVVEKDEEKSIQDINYEDAITYWNHIPPTVNGMLGGFGFISSTDLQGSEMFLKNLFQLKNHPDHGTAVDCGAGIGRITKHLLMHHFKKVDLVEPVKPFIDEARNYIQNDEKIGVYHNIGLQDFNPCVKYDLIWCQWVLSHLTNQDLIKFFKTCRDSLNPNGVIVVKENLSSNQEGDIDEQDSSRTRHEKELKQLFTDGGLKVIKEAVQKKFPKGLYCVKMFALRPDSSTVLQT